MKTDDSQKIVHEIAESTDSPEEVVSQMYSDAVQAYQQDARILDYVPLFAARRVRETLRSRTPTR
jgi:thymidylate kinase